MKSIPEKLAGLAGMLAALDDSTRNAGQMTIVIRKDYPVNMPVIKGKVKNPYYRTERW